ncbi:MAG: hypothetical protein ACFB9M_00485 [Myxococcota bacterium]
MVPTAAPTSRRPATAPDAVPIRSVRAFGTLTKAGAPQDGCPWPASVVGDAVHQAGEHLEQVAMALQ